LYSLIFGIGGVIAGFVRGLPGGANLNVTIYNTGALVGAIFHFMAAMILLSGISPELGSRQKGTWLIVGYPGVIIFMALLTTASLMGFIPPFFIQGVGPTPLRQGILGTADILFFFSFLIFIGTYFRNKEVFLYWYALALALTSISLSAFFIESSIGSPVGWAGRFSQYFGGVYFLISLITATRSAHDRKTSLDNVLTASLSPAEETFRALAENSPDVINRFDKEMKYIYTNMAGLRLLGKSADSIIGKTIEESGVPEPYCSGWKERIRQVFETGQPIEMEDYFPTVDGVRFYQSRCVPEYGADGTVTNVLVVSHDLTERMRATEALKESEQRYHSLFERMIAGFALHRIIIDDNGKPVDYVFLEANPAFERLTGFMKKDIIGRRVTEVIPGIERDPADWIGVYGRVAETGKEIEFEQYSEHIGKWFTVLAYSPMKDHFAVTFADITERRRTEQEIQCLLSSVQLEKDRLSALINSISDEIWFADTEKRFTLANLSARKEFGIESAEAIDVEKLAEKLEVYRLDGSLRPVEEAPPLRALKGEVLRNQEEIIRTPVSGELRYRQVSSTPVRDAAGNIIGSVSVVRDITERKRAEEALRRSEKQYRELFENMIDGFAYCKMVFENGKPQDFIYLSVNHAFSMQENSGAAWRKDMGRV
jgi:PAS domain S-box-containing protein